MTARTRIRPVQGMARQLAAYRPRDRATPEAAALLMLQEGLYCPDDIAAGIDAALALVEAGLDAAASDRPLARAAAWAGDGAALAVILLGGMRLWGWLA